MLPAQLAIVFRTALNAFTTQPTKIALFVSKDSTYPTTSVQHAQIIHIAPPLLKLPNALAPSSQLSLEAITKKVALKTTQLLTATKPVPLPALSALKATLCKLSPIKPFASQT